MSFKKQPPPPKRVFTAPTGLKLPTTDKEKFDAVIDEKKFSKSDIYFIRDIIKSGYLTKNATLEEIGDLNAKVKTLYRTATEELNKPNLDKKKIDKFTELKEISGKVSNQLIEELKEKSEQEEQHSPSKP